MMGVTEGDEERMKKKNGETRESSVGPVGYLTERMDGFPKYANMDIRVIK